jgi:phosphoserine phosphatase
MKLILVRHGETHENVKRISQGHFNSQLTERGMEQARLVAERLKKEHIDVAYSSDLDRALNTCKEILKHHPKIELFLIKDLREQAKGIYEGKPHEGRDLLLKEKNIPFHEWKPEGGESLGNVWHKVVRVFDDIKIKHKDKTVLVVSHGGPISCLIAYLHNESLKDYHKYLPKKNTAITIVDFKGETPVFKRLNSTCHLE